MARSRITELVALSESRGDEIGSLGSEVQELRTALAATERSRDVFREAAESANRQNTYMKIGGAIVVGLAVYDKVIR